MLSITGLGRSSIYKLMSKGDFPMSISLGERAVAWEVSEVEEWVSDKIERRNETIGKLDKVAPVVTEVKVSEADVIEFIKNKFSKLSISDAITWLIQAYN